MTTFLGLKLFTHQSFRRLNFKRISVINLQTVLISSQKLVYSEFGDPAKVVRLEHEELREPKETEVLVRMLAAPLNPADINTIQGVYPSKPVLPAVPGNEGVGEVVSAGSAVLSLRPGDHVTPYLPTNLGTWRTHAVFQANEVCKVPKELGVVEAATMSVNPYTAYRMLKDFVPLSEGDVVIQNGANSACGQNVIQLCKLWGLRSINVVRNRPDIGELKRYLMDLGATYVLTEEELRETEMFKTKEVQRPRLALNCVGGRNSLMVLKQLDRGGTMVTYGAMSREPVPAHNSLFIFKDLRLRGYWMTAWTNKHAGMPEHLQMKEEVSRMLMDGSLRPPVHKLVPISQYKEAVTSVLRQTGFVGLKYVFDFQREG
ncbi:enoyl-[acyl-carrier-protein] reductase, mitochondrial [Bacillus rossius redtenbacheri]|uniref:enoyl-[acyl-carrier-protein] reductase, mitochondrial n=1 Tax=Bacillus rossius redtenbacheri TaxID=93214 RepID=UPI002FDD99CF